MKTGLHANDTKDHAKILDYYRRSGANVFKTLVFHDDLLAELRSMGVTTIGRLHFDQQPVGGSAAKKNLARILDSAARHPAVTHWEGYNEAYQGPQASQDSTQQDKERSGMARYAEWEIERIDALAEVGAFAVVGCFSCGTPDLDTDAWLIFRPVLQRALERGGALGLHEYAGPYMQWMLETPDGKNQWRNNQSTGASANGIWDPYVTGWLCLRYRKVWAKYLQPWGLGRLPIFVGEGGIDDTTPRPGPPGKGYKAFRRGGWDALPGIGDYAEQRRWYMVQMTHDNGVGRPLALGAVDFGWEGTPTDWPDFDLATDPDMVERILAAEALLPRPFVANPPAPVPVPPAPAPGGNMNQIESAIVGAATAEHALRGLPFTPKNALVAAAKIPPGVLLPTTDEFPVVVAGAKYVAQRFQASDTGKVSIGYCRAGEWGTVHWIGDRPKA